MPLDPFASPNDVAVRLGRSLGDVETAQVDALLRDASAILRARFPGIDVQIAAGSLDEQVVTTVAANMARRAMIAPTDGVAQSSETVGPFARSMTFTNPLGNVYLAQSDLDLILGYRPGGVSMWAA